MKRKKLTQRRQDAKLRKLLSFAFLRLYASFFPA